MATSSQKEEFESIRNHFRYSCWRPIESSIAGVETLVLYRDWYTPLIVHVKKEWLSTVKICTRLTRKITEGQLSVVNSSLILKFAFDECNYRNPLWDDIIRDCIWLKHNKSTREEIYFKCRHMVVSNEYNSKLVKVLKYFEDLRETQIARSYGDLKRIKAPYPYTAQDVQVTSEVVHDRNESFKSETHDKRKTSWNMIKCKWTLDDKLRIFGATNREVCLCNTVSEAMKQEGIFTVSKHLITVLVDVYKERGRLK